MIFISLEKNVPSHQQALLKRSYVPSEIFEFDTTSANNTYEIICNYISGNRMNQFERLNTIRHSYPLLLHANSISSGLVFNYTSYLKRQVGSSEKKIEIAFHEF
jgi:hypothetical protein